MWYSVEALFQCDDTNEKSKEVLYEKSIFLIKVENEQYVREKAERIAQAFEVDYKNVDNDKVKWEFVKILDIQDICEDELYDGVEVFSKLQWDAE